MARSPAPHGAGGLKFWIFGMLLIIIKSRPARGGWIEMAYITLGK